ncbi:MAG: hypothetical protein AB7G13_30630 [Lautropia sp.]
MLAIALLALLNGLVQLHGCWPRSPLLHAGGPRDPFDRLLIARAITEPLHLLTVDEQLSRYGDMVMLAG